MRAHRMWEQLSLAAFLQRHWADNQVCALLGVVVAAVVCMCVWVYVYICVLLCGSFLSLSFWPSHGPVYSLIIIIAFQMCVCRNACRSCTVSFDPATEGPQLESALQYGIWRALLLSASASASASSFFMICLFLLQTCQVFVARPRTFCTDSDLLVPLPFPLPSLAPFPLPSLVCCRVIPFDPYCSVQLVGIAIGSQVLSISVERGVVFTARRSGRLSSNAHSTHHRGRISAAQSHVKGSIAFCINLRCPPSCCYRRNYRRQYLPHHDQRE
jgi:hypothetical protein